MHIYLVAERRVNDFLYIPKHMIELYINFNY